MTDEQRGEDRTESKMQDEEDVKVRKIASQQRKADFTTPAQAKLPRRALHGVGVRILRESPRSREQYVTLRELVEAALHFRDVVRWMSLLPTRQSGNARVRRSTEELPGARSKL